MRTCHTAIKGRLKTMVVNGERTILESSWHKNLLLDQGLDTMAAVPLCSLFLFAVKGRGEAVTGTYTQATTTVTRASGARDFVDADRGKRITFLPSGDTANIISITSVSAVLTDTSQTESAQSIRLDSPTLEAVAAANSFSQTNGSLTVTRTAGTRNFTTADVGKLIRFTGGTNHHETMIQAINSTTSVATSKAPTATITSQDIALYHVGQVGLNSEVSRTNTYSTVANENGTVTGDGSPDATNLRRFTRTFVFDPEETYNELVPATNTYSQAGTTVTRTAGTRDFTAADVGRVIEFQTSGATGTIASITGVDEVEVGVSATVDEQAIRITGTNSFLEVVSGVYSRASSTVTRTSGSRDFTAADVGKIIHWGTDETETKITAFTSATVVTVDVSGTLTGETISLYSFTDVSEIGFSNTEEKGDNINIRVLLDTPVRLYPATPLRLSDQLKVTYECEVTVTPNTTAAQNLGSVILDTGNNMSSNKNGSRVIETFATSLVTSTGETDIGLPDLEPFYDGFAALSLNADALAPLTGKIRSSGVVSVPMTADTYVAGDFFKTFTAVFGLNDGNSTAIRSMMIFDPQTESAIFTFLFTANQIKDGDHALTVKFKKAWGRDLS